MCRRCLGRPLGLWFRHLAAQCKQILGYRLVEFQELLRKEETCSYVRNTITVACCNTQEKPNNNNNEKKQPSEGEGVGHRSKVKRKKEKKSVWLQNLHLCVICVHLCVVSAVRHFKKPHRMASSSLKPLPSLAEGDWKLHRRRVVREREREILMCGHNVWTQHSPAALKFNHYLKLQLPVALISFVRRRERRAQSVQSCCFCHRLAYTAAFLLIRFKLHVLTRLS